MPASRTLRASVFAFAALAAEGELRSTHALTVTPQLTLTDSAASDQDDLCVWVHPTDTSLSTVIASDKVADRLFVYDLHGDVVQSVSVSGQPGNIDVRYGFPLNGDPVDIVAVNDRATNRLLVYTVDSATRQLTRIDGNALSIGANYGVSLYRSPVTGAFHAFVTSESGAIRQYELFDSGGQIAHSQVRSWSFDSKTEGCVCDDETGAAYFGEENEGIWRVGAEPGDPTSGTLVAEVGDGSGLAADVEGLAIYYAGGGGGYLFASSQGNSKFNVYARTAPHAPVMQFDVTGVGSADGIDVANVPLGPDFPFGLFATHDDTQTPKPIQVCAYEDLGLDIDTDYWHPRQGPPVSVVTPPAATSDRMEIHSRPNPFRQDTRIRFSLAEPAVVRLDVLDPAGRRVRMLLDGRPLPSGTHAEVWDGRDAGGRPVVAGVYFTRLATDVSEVTGKTTVVR